MSGWGGSASRAARAQLAPLVAAGVACLVRGARGRLDERRAQRRTETRRRLETTLTRTTVPPWKRRNPLSCRGELSSSLHTKKYRAPAPGLPPTLPIGEDMPACAICGRTEHACRTANAKEPYAIAHAYEPSRIGQRRTVLAPAHELHPPAAHKQQRGGWRALVNRLNQPAHPRLMDGDDQ